MIFLAASVTWTEAVRLSEEEREAKPEAEQPPPEPRRPTRPGTPPSPTPESRAQAPERPSQRPPERQPDQETAETQAITPEPTDRVIQAPERKPQKKSVTIDFDNVDMLLFIKFISEVTGKNFIVDRKVQGKVTIISPTKISVDEAYQVFLSVLEVHGFTTVDSGNVIKIVPSTEARGKSIETRLREESLVPKDKVVTQLIRLDYANPDELKKLFAPLISKSSVIISYPPSGMLIVTDVLSNINRLLKIIGAIDVPGVGEEISIIPIEHATAEILGQTLTTIFQTTGGAPAARTRGRAPRASAVAPAIQIVADERTNSLIVSASEHDTLRIKHLINILDQETPRGTGNIRVHYLQHADAEELAGVLTNLPKEQGQAPQKGKAPAISKEVQIVADKATNSLVITANKQDYQALMDVVSKLDIPRPMVYIEALVMEVTTGANFSVGVQWQGADFIGSHESNNIDRDIAAFIQKGSGGVAVNTSALNMGIVGEAIEITVDGITTQFPTISAMIQAFKAHSDVHILQTPQLLTTDNEEASIDVVTNRAFLTKSATGEQEYDVFEYKDVGSKLTITPQINQNRFVRLQIEQEFSTFSGTGEGDKPETFKRTAKTTVVVKDQETVALGGLVGEQISHSTGGVPCLGDIPVVGWLFKSYSRERDRTNLFIFLTPHVLATPEEAAGLSGVKREEIDMLQEGSIKLYEDAPGAEEQPEGEETMEAPGNEENQGDEADETSTDR